MIRAFGAVCEGSSADGTNEDAYLAFSERELFGIADGYGGHQYGREAAGKTLELVKTFVENGLGDKEVTLPFVYRSYYTPGANLVFNAFLYANQIIFDENKKKSMSTRGGASTLFAFFQGRHLTIGNIGNCQALLVRKGKVSSLLNPRSYLFLQNGNLSVGESWRKSWTFPLAGIGHAKDLEPEILEFKVQPGDVLFLASDGIYSHLKPEDFSQYSSVITERLAQGHSLDATIAEENQRLTKLALERGNSDDKSLISLVCC